MVDLSPADKPSETNIYCWRDGEMKGFDGQTKDLNKQMI